VTQIALGRFHHFHLARQLESQGRLKEIWTGYPRFKLKDEHGVPIEKIRSFPWFYVPANFLPRFGPIARSPKLIRDMQWRAVNAIDRHVARRMRSPTTVVSMSGGGLSAGKRAMELGGAYICDRGSTHIRFQDSILREEYALWGMEFVGVDPRIFAKEEAEYALADRITVPSRFCHRSFLEAGVPAEKLRVIPYGGRLDRFKPEGQPDAEAFTIVFVGGVSVRKGIPYLLKAFARIAHPRKRLKLIGVVPPESEALLRRLPLDNVEFLGAVPNLELARHYSTADVMVLPSLEEGLALVMAEAMACGCPVIASENTGALDLFTEGEHGRIVPVRSVAALVDALESIVQDRVAARDMGGRARAQIQSLGGYDRYGQQWNALLKELETGCTR
jgi:glycosyltransferase involved in cell wall biosynthesis